MGWIEEARRPVSAVAGALGWDGDDRRGYPCPACREAKRDRRGAVGVSRQGWGWECHVCKERGDGLDYLAWALAGARLQALEQDQRRDLRDWLRAQGWLTGPVSPFQVAPPAAPKVPERDLPPEYPPADEVAALWAEARPVREVEPVRDFLVGRGLRPWGRALIAADLARALPLSTAWPSWWPARRAATWRLVVQAWDARGELRSLHARAVVPPPVVEGRALPKVLWPKGYESRELLFACPEAQALLRGEPSPGLFSLVVAEGLTDWLTLASWAQHVGAGRADRVAVIGGTSGAWGALSQAILPADLDVVVAVDEDATGDRYLLEIADALGERPLRRFAPSSLLPALARKAA